MTFTLRYEAIDFEQHLVDAVATFCRTVKPRDGSSHREIERTKTQLQCPIPSIVERYCVILGHAHDLNQVYDHIHNPSELKLHHFMDQDYLVLCQTHQEISSFGVKTEDAGQEDPPVFQILDDGSMLAFERSSSFYSFEVLWQIINGLAPFRATSYPSKTTVKQLRKDSVAITFSKNNTGDLNFYQQEQCLLLITTEGKKHVVAVAGKKKDTVHSFCERYALEVSWFREPL